VPERRKPAGRFILYTVYFILEPVGRSLAATKGVRLGRGLHGASYFILYTLYFWYSRVAPSREGPLPGYFILYTPSREGPLPDGLKYKV